MPVTLAQAQVNAATDVDYFVIDNFRRYDNLLLDRMVFDDVVTPGTGGGSMVYGYTRLTQAASAGTRAINAEYIPSKAIRAQVTVQLKLYGTSFELDRVLRNLGQAATNELSFQLQQALIATRMKWNQDVILGDTAVDANGFDGLSKILTGSTTEATTLNISSGTIITQVAAMQALDKIDMWLATIIPSRTGSGDMSPGSVLPGEKAILGNTVSITRLKALARMAGMYTAEKDDLGRAVERYNGWLLIDLGDRNDGSGPVIPTVANVTELYAVTFGVDALHAASLAGAPLLQMWQPDWSTAGAVKLGEVEMSPSALVLKSTKAAGVYRAVTVTP